MKVLFLSQRFLLPMDTGGKIRTGKLLEKLSRRHSITVISNVESPKDDPLSGDMACFCKRFVPVRWKEPERYSPRFWLDLARKSFSRFPVSVLNDWSRSLEAAVLAELACEPYDLAICDFLQSTLNFRRVSGVPTLLFEHNVESSIPLRHRENSSNSLSRLFWHLQYRKMVRHEGEMCRRFDGVVAVSQTDAERFREWFRPRRLFTIPTGVDTEYFQPSESPSDRARLVFTGSMDWLPNEDAMLFFLERVFPLVKREVPECELSVVGKNPSRPFLAAIEGRDDVTSTGWVEDVRPYLESSSVFVVPIRIGGGTRIKIFEAMAAGVPVVSTTVGAEGLPIADGEHAFLADREDEIAERIVRLIRDRGLRSRIAERARRYVEENFGWDRVADVFSAACEEVAALEVAGSASPRETDPAPGGEHR